MHLLLCFFFVHYPIHILKILLQPYKTPKSLILLCNFHYKAPFQSLTIYLFSYIA